MSGSHIVVDYEELNRMASVWAEAGRAMVQFGSRVAALTASPELAMNAVFDPAGGARAEAAILRAAIGPRGLAALGLRMSADSTLLSAVVQKERLVDDLPLRQIIGVEEWLATLPIELPLDPARALRQGELRLNALVDAVPGYVAPYLEPLLGAFAPAPQFRLDVAQHRPLTVDPVFGLPVKRLLAAADAHPGNISMSRYSPSWGALPPASIATMLDRVGDLENADEATLAIQRIVGPDGVARFVVVLPGMRHFAGSPDPQDLVGAASAMVATSTGYAKCVRQAIDAAGVPPGAEVVLVGHSQGGIVAMDLAGDPDFNGLRVRVSQVVAAGAPISSKAVVPDSNTRVLNIENVHDIVPHLDAVESPTTHQSVDRLTYRFAVDARGVARTHDVGRYAEQMRALAGSPNPLLARVSEGLQPYTSGSASTTVFALHDAP